MLNAYWNMINESNLVSTPKEPDFNGIIVAYYQQILRECDVISHGIIKHFIVYNTTNDSIKS